MKEKILLLTDVQPCKNYSGAIVSLQLVKFLQEEKIETFCICVKDYAIKEKVDLDVSSKLKTLVLKKPTEEITTRVNQKYSDEIKKIINLSIDFIVENKITKIWCPVQGGAIIDVLDGIVKKTKLPYVVQVWDPIEWIISEKGYTKEKQKVVLKSFERLIKKSSYCLTASKPMSELYRKIYNKSCVEIYSSILFPNIEKKKVNSTDFVIALSGQMYATDEIRLLIDSLIKNNWTVNGKNIIFRYYGSTPAMFFGEKKYICKNIELLGFVEQNKLMSEMSKADLLYCPYFFSNDSILRKVAELSFPSKLVTYIPCKTPVLIHAPNYSSIHRFFKGTNAGYCLSDNNYEKIINLISKAINDSNDYTKIEKMEENLVKLFNNNFTQEKMKKNFFKGLQLKYEESKKKRILEVNYVDLPGKAFSGYDLQEYINDNTKDISVQIVTYKTSINNNVLTYHNSPFSLETEYKVLDFESNELSVHSNLSITSPILLNHDAFRNADIVHYHMIHNAKLSLYSLIELCNKKPSILTIHDPWIFTGRCVHYYNCNKWQNGCNNCPNLNSLFPFKKDNCSKMWYLKKFVYSNIDIDIVVPSKYMFDLVKKSPLTKSFKHVHLIPFGINSEFFSARISPEEAKEKFGIPKDNIVLFLRAQRDFKGTNYIVEAMKKLVTEKKITLLSCSQVGLLDDLKSKYDVCDLGNIDQETLVYAYNACDFFLMPSTGESFGMMAIEAMSCSKPVVVFDNTALPSITYAPECGYLVKNLDSDDLKNAIEYLINNPEEVKKRGNLARKIVVENYDINVYNNKIMNLYEEVYNRKHVHFNPEKNVDDNNSDVVNIKSKLNFLTSRLYKRGSVEYRKLFYAENKIEKNYIDIDYSNIMVQEVIDKYNKKLNECINNYEEIINNGGYNPSLYTGVLRIRIIRLFYYIFKDRWTLKCIISAKLKNYPKMLDLIKKVYHKFK